MLRRGTGARGGGLGVSWCRSDQLCATFAGCAGQVVSLYVWVSD